MALGVLTSQLIGCGVSASKGSVWTSLTGGRHYRVRVTDNHVYTEWVDLPVRLRGSEAFDSMDLQKQGDKWVGKVRAFVPVTNNVDQTTYWCHFENDAEITGMTKTRIEGRARIGRGVKNGTCKETELSWRAFVWIPNESP